MKKRVDVRIPGSDITIRDASQKQGIVVGVKGMGKTTFLYNFVLGLWNVWYWRFPFIAVDPVGTLARWLYQSFSKILVVKVSRGDDIIFNLPPPVVYNLQFLTGDERKKFMDKLALNIPNNCILIIDELQEFIPQSKKMGFAHGFLHFTLRARNSNIGIIGATQRISLVDKSYVNNCNYMVLFKQTGLADLQYLRELLKLRYDTSTAKKVVKEVSALSRGEFIYIEF